MSLTITRRVLAAILLFASLQCGAATLTIVPVDDVSAVRTGDDIRFDIFYDLSEYPDLIAGAFDVVYDSTAVALVSVEPVIVGDPLFFRAPDELDGLLESWSFADFFGLPLTAYVGRFSLSVLPTMGATTEVFGQGTSGIGGPWCGAFDFCFLAFPVQYNSITLQRVPLPGAILLLGSALLGLARLRSNR